MPQKPAGMRIDPPPSLPSARQPMPVAAAVAAPELLPPGLRSRFQGLRVMPVRGLSPQPFQPNSGVVVRPRKTALAARRRAIDGASSAAMSLSDEVREPRPVGLPFTIIRSFSETGTPSSRPSGAPRIQRASDAFAWASASSAQTPQKPLMAGSRRSIWARTAFVTSTGDRRRAR